MRLAVTLQITLLGLLAAIYYPKDDGYRDFQTEVLRISILHPDAGVKEAFEAYRDKRRATDSLDINLISVALLLQCAIIAITLKRSSKECVSETPFGRNTG